MARSAIKTELNWKGNEAVIKGKKMTGRSVWEIALFVEGQWKLLAPVDTGRYAGSVTVEMRDRSTPFSMEGGTAPETQDKIGKPTNPLEAVVGTNVEYGPYVEYGTVRSAAQPAARPALDLARGKAVTIVRKNGKQEFRDY